MLLIFFLFTLRVNKGQPPIYYTTADKDMHTRYLFSILQKNILVGCDQERELYCLRAGRIAFKRLSVQQF